MMLAAHADASDKRASREREALRRTQQALSQTQADLSAAQQEKAGLAENLEKTLSASRAAEEKVSRLQREHGASTRQIASLTQALTLAKEELTTTAQHLAETRKTLAETTQSLQAVTADKRNLEDLRTRNTREIAACERKNLALYDLGRSLMDRFEHKTCGEVLAEKEPFTGLRKVETENLLEAYRDKLDDQKWVKAPERP
jgi:chromosome segregation ATPase